MCEQDLDIVSLDFLMFLFSIFMIFWGNYFAQGTVIFRMDLKTFSTSVARVQLQGGKFIELELEKQSTCMLGGQSREVIVPGWLGHWPPAVVFFLFSLPPSIFPQAGEKVSTECRPPAEVGAAESD